MKNRFFVQPGWLDFSMFWSLIIIGISLAIILQMEIVGYGPVSLPALGLLVTLAVAGLQVGRSQLCLTKRGITLQRLLPANSVILQPADVLGVQWHKHSVTLATRTYGKLSVVYFGHLAQLEKALAALLPERG